MSLTPEKIIAVVVILLVAFPVHEFSHALAAYRLGDGTARLFGRLTLNPIVHFDPIGGGMMILSSLFGVGIGWAKPTPVNPMNLRGGRNGEAIVAAAGPLSNLVIAMIAAIPLRFIDAAFARGDLQGLPVVVPNVLVYLVIIDIALMLFNFIPIPPLDGSKVLYAALDPATAFRVRPVLEQYGVFIFLVLVFFPIGGQTLFGAVFHAIGDPLFGFLVGRAPFLYI
ncbi:MAG TPA: site-2 protease family protein [Candidatus Limnocylindrales bacterium]